MLIFALITDRMPELPGLSPISAGNLPGFPCSPTKDYLC